MARRLRNRPGGFEGVLNRIEGVVNSPLAEIGRRLQSTILGIQQADRDGSAAINEAELARDIDAMLQLLPKSFGDRFRFDSGMITATCETFHNIGLALNPMILPLHGSTWAHNSLPMPWSKGDKISMVDFIRLPGTDDLDDVSLLAYPLLLHEIGHNILFRYGASFSERFRADLETITNRFRLSSIADRGRARSNYQNRIEMIRRYWTPSPNHKNWASESAIDVIAFWVCGPAYLAALCDEMDQRHVQPYFLEQEHPPNFVRMSALRSVAVRLGWTKHLGAVDQLLDRWKRTSQGPTSRHNEYVALADPQIIDACVATSLSACEELHLPLCDQETIKRINQELSNGATPDLGIDILIGAWLMHEQNNEASYAQWEATSVRDLLNYVTL